MARGKKKSRATGRKPVQKRKKPVVSDGFLAGFFGAKAAGLSDEESFISAVLFDDED